MDKVLDDIKLTMQLCKVFPNFVVGYDLVAQEDPYNTLLFYKDALLYPESQTPPVHLQYFFHAGETSKYKSHYFGECIFHNRLLIYVTVSYIIKTTKIFVLMAWFLAFNGDIKCEAQVKVTLRSAYEHKNETFSRMITLWIDPEYDYYNTKISSTYA